MLLCASRRVRNRSEIPLARQSEHSRFCLLRCAISQLVAKYRILDPQKFDFGQFHRYAVKFLSAQDDT